MPSDKNEQRHDFEGRFGAEQAKALIAAAASHANLLSEGNKRGSDELRDAIIIAIGFDCVSDPAYAAYHGLTIDAERFDAWLKEPAQRRWLANHDGPIDYLSLMCGTYSDYMPEQTDAQ